MGGATLVETLEDEVPTVLVVAKFIGDLQQARWLACRQGLNLAAIRAESAVCVHGPPAGVLHRADPLNGCIRKKGSLARTASGGGTRSSFVGRGKGCSR